MTHARSILDYLWSIAPDGATNGQIARKLGIRSHQTVYMVTQDLLQRGLIRGEQEGRTWVFYVVEEQVAGPALYRETSSLTASGSGPMSPVQFEMLARRALSRHYGTELSPGSVPGVRKRFDLVSPDRQIVGDAKYYTLARGVALPSAKFSTIAEHVWLLEKTGAPTTFLVFGNDRQVPVLWLERYGNLVSSVAFYFLSGDGHVEQL